MTNYHQIHRITSAITAAMIAIVIVWSVVNVSAYAKLFHNSIFVWSIGIAVGTCNALSVFAYATTTDRTDRIPAIIGILLFGGTSGTLQSLLYLHEGAPIIAALAFGWFGPIAEGLLAWLEAALRLTLAQPVANTIAPDLAQTTATPTVQPPTRSTQQLSDAIATRRQAVADWLHNNKPISSRS